MTTSEVAKFAGVSIRQLQWWDETKLLVPGFKRGPGGTGMLRDYSAEDAQRALLIGDLRRRGVPIGHCRGVIRRFDKRRDARFLVVGRTGWCVAARGEADALGLATVSQEPVWIAEVKGTTA